jgi:pilus assembly protein CpaE
MLRIAIVDPADATREPLRSLLLGIDSIWLEAECTRYEFFGDVLAQSIPDLAIVSLDSDRNRSLNLISLLSSQLPRLPVLAIGSDHQSLLQSLQRGAKYFLTQPVVLEDMLSTLRRVQGDLGLVAGTPSGQPTHASRIIAILGSRGGIGCTTVAVNLGCTLAADPNNSVVLLDLDLAMGDADVYLDVMADHTIADLAMNIERLDMNFIKRSMIRHESTGLFLLPHPLQIADVSTIHEDHLNRILQLLRISHTHLILDLSKALMPTDLTALRLADDVLLVSQLELSSLRNVVRILMALGHEEGLADKVQVVVNRVGSETLEGDISLKKAEDIIGKGIFWQIPNDAKAALAAKVEGVPLIRHAPRSRVHQSIVGLAKALTPDPEPVAVEPAARKSGFLSRVVGS